MRKEWGGIMKVGFIGVGNMGGAILTGYYEKTKGSGREILIFDQRLERMEELQSEMAVTICKDITQLTREADIIILGAKPVDFQNLLSEIKDTIKDDVLLISMAAGVKIDFIRNLIGKKGSIIRIMPNIPALVNMGVTSISRDEKVPEDLFQIAKEIFESVGKVYEVPEDLIHTVIGISGSSPAYTYMYIDGLVKAAEKRGMKRDEALDFAANSVMGAAKMVIETGIDPDQLKLNVCSPNGTTVEAVRKLEELDFYNVIDQAFGAAHDRSKEMEG